MGVVGRPDLAQDPALQSNDGRVKRNAELDDVITAWTMTVTVDEALTALEQAEVPAGRIYSVQDIVKDPHYLAREMVVPATLPDGVEVKMPGITPKLSETPGGVNWLGPKIGEHTDEVLRGLGLGNAEIETLRAAGAVQ
jgi:crotonobetainyl-CoA:carnitine CoA-transferase CaiB-like acyl-CoA transferase